MAGYWLARYAGYDFRVIARRVLKERLVTVKPLPTQTYNSSHASKYVIYVLGGSHAALKAKFLAASVLFKQRGIKKILVLSVPGITHYDPRRGRNLTNDEWARDYFVELGVNDEYIELVSIEGGFFGTFSEAKGISKILSSRNCKGLILVSSSYHTMRAWFTFNRILADQRVDIYVYSAHDDTSLANLLFEYFKLSIYKHLLIPFHQYFITASYQEA